MPNRTRRDFARLVSAAGAAVALPRPVAAAVHPFAPGIKISVQVGSDPKDEDLQFVKQLGCEYVNVNTNGGAQSTLDNFRRLKNKVTESGLKVWNIGNTDVHNMEEVTLNLPGRDQKIEQYKQFLRNLGKVGVYYTTYAHMGNGIWSSDRGTTRGGSPARTFDLKTAKGKWASKVFEGPLTHGRKFSEQEMWDNYTYFIKAVVPVAEQEGIRIGIHPDDPPVPVLGGVPRNIFGNMKGYLRALEIANSPNVGVCLCCGTWMEGGKYTGASVIDAIRTFGKMGKLWKIHFRNVSQPISEESPKFTETFVDNGYTDMWQVMRALREVNFDGCVIGDHFPDMIGGNKVSVAYTVGYMKALLNRANAEFAGRKA